MLLGNSVVNLRAALMEHPAVSAESTKPLQFNVCDDVVIAGLFDMGFYTERPISYHCPRARSEICGNHGAIISEHVRLHNAFFNRIGATVNPEDYLCSIERQTGGTLSYGKLLFSDFAHSLSEKDLTVREILIKDSFTFGFLMLFFYSVWVVIMASWLSLFHQNITLKKRLILTVMCCVPLVFGTLYCIFDDSQNNQFHFKLLLGGLFPVFFINWPAILLGAPFVEFFPHLCRKIPLPWFQFPEQEDSHSD